MNGAFEKHVIPPKLMSGGCLEFRVAPLLGAGLVLGSTQKDFSIAKPPSVSATRVFELGARSVVLSERNVR